MRDFILQAESVSNISSNSPEWFKRGIEAALLAPILMLALCACNDDGKKTSSDNSGNNADSLSAESVSGSYSNAGGSIVNSVAWDEFYDSVSMDFKITAVNPNTILVSMGSLGVYSDIAEMPYDPTTGVARWSDDNATYTLTFTRSGDGYAVHLTEYLGETLFMDFYGEKTV